jgi:hypothetical protein
MGNIWTRKKAERWRIRINENMKSVLQGEGIVKYFNP